MELTIIRHLPTSWNIEGRLQGWKDIDILPISADSARDIKKNLLQLRKNDFDFILSSPLKRTQQTACHYGFQPAIEELLIELRFGPFEGQLKKELQNHFANQWLEKPSELFLGEKVANLELRIQQFLEKYKHAGKILAFGHGSWIRALKSYHQFGHINEMNKETVKNNELVTLEFNIVEAGK